MGNTTVSYVTNYKKLLSHFLMMGVAMFFVVLGTFAMTNNASALGGSTGGSGGSKTDQLYNSYSNGTKTSDYHIFADDLDWTKPVGLFIYTDGSGEWGLNNPNNTYLLDADGTNGLVAKAKAHNLLLVTPFAPGNGCTDGDGVCWYLNSNNGTTIAQKTKWAYDLAVYLQGRYNVDPMRGVIAGYSSGAQFTSEYFGPQYAESIMSDGLMVPISYGGSPKVTASYSTSFKNHVPVVWDTGDLDPAYTTTSVYGVNAGYNWYTTNGFTTELNVVAGEDHDRTGDFDAIMDREIGQHVRSVSTYTSWNTTVSPTKTGGTFTTNVPSTYSGSVYVRLSSGNYLYEIVNGASFLEQTFSAQACGTTLNWQVEAPSGTVRKTGTFSTLAC